MTREWLVLFWEVIKKWLRDTEVYAWAVVILVTILVAILGSWWTWRRNRRLGLLPGMNELYDMVTRYLAYIEENGHVDTDQWNRLNEMLAKCHFLSHSKRMWRFLRKLLDDGNSYRGQGQVVEGRKWALEQQKTARKLFRGMLKVGV